MPPASLPIRKIPSSEEKTFRKSNSPLSIWPLKKLTGLNALFVAFGGYILGSRSTQAFPPDFILQNAVRGTFFQLGSPAYLAEGNFGVLRNQLGHHVGIGLRDLGCGATRARLAGDRSGFFNAANDSFDSFLISRRKNRHPSIFQGYQL